MVIPLRYYQNCAEILILFMDFLLEKNRGEKGSKHGGTME